MRVRKLQKAHHVVFLHNVEHAGAYPGLNLSPILGSDGIYDCYRDRALFRGDL